MDEGIPIISHECNEISTLIPIWADQVMPVTLRRNLDCNG